MHRLVVIAGWDGVPDSSEILANLAIEKDSVHDWLMALVS